MSDKSNIEQICIVGVGCVYPGAVDSNALWKMIYESKPQFAQVSEKRFVSYESFVSSDRTQSDKTYSDLAAEISDEIINTIAMQNNISQKDYNRLEIMMIEATRQAIQDIRIDFNNKRIETIMGTMNNDEASYNFRFLEIKEKYFLELKSCKEIINPDYWIDVTNRAFQDRFGVLNNDPKQWLTTSVMKKVRSFHNIQKGPDILIDAACASSLAAFDIAYKKLLTNKADIILAGGFESVLSAGSYILFSRVGALSDNGPCLPYDHKSTGMTQGEGCAVIALERLSDARRQGHRILGIIKSTGASSDGKSSSLFQPTVNGQLLAYNRAYKNFDNFYVDYIEGHGTGTNVGDRVEIESLSKFFHNMQVPIGSIKSLIGHTKGAAGSAGLIKCLGIIKNRTIPPAHYFEKFPNGIDSDLYVAKKPITITQRNTPIRTSISGFGFGGTNFHLVLEEYVPNHFSNRNIKVITNNENKNTFKTSYIVGDHYVSINDFEILKKNSFFKIPPNSIKQIDRIQLLALWATEDALKKCVPHYYMLPSDSISVISACNTGLDAFISFIQRTCFSVKDIWTQPTEQPYSNNNIEDKSLQEIIKNDSEIIKKLLLVEKNKHPIPTEDSGPGILNNVIAGRICNAFDFKDSNFNVDCDLASIAASIDIALTDLELNDKLIILVAVDETIDDNNLKFNRNGVHVLFLTSQEYARKHNISLKSKIDTLKYLYEFI